MSDISDRKLAVWILDPANLTPFYSHALADGLAQIGDDVAFVTTKFLYDPDLQPPPSIQYIEHYFRYSEGVQRVAGRAARRIYRLTTYPWEHARLLREARRERPDVVHLQWSRVPWLDLWLVKSLRRQGVAVVHTVHDVTPLFRAAGGKTLGRVYECCDALIVHTPTNKRDLLAAYPYLSNDRIHVVPHGPLQADAVPADASPEQARKDLGVPEGVPVALFFGTIKRYKGLDILVQAFEDVRRQLPNAHLLIAGRPGSPGDTPDLRHLYAQKCVTANLGFIPNSDVWKYYAAADVVVLPYRDITQSGVLLSTFALGRAAIVTAVGGLPDVVRQGETGWVVPPESPAELANAVVEALSDCPKTHAMGEAAKRYVNTELSWERIAATTHGIYQTICRSSK